MLSLLFIENKSNAKIILECV